MSNIINFDDYRKKKMQEKEVKVEVIDNQETEVSYKDLIEKLNSLQCSIQKIMNAQCFPTNPHESSNAGKHCAHIKI